MKTLINDGLRFVCSTEAELYRARTLLTKEPGTIKWLKDNCREGDVFYDIGANIGCYTLYAARLVGADGEVWAFEPHVGNAYSLLQNIRVNRMSDRVRVLTCPLNDVNRFERFRYGSIEAGSSGSEFGVTDVQDAEEIKYGMTLDGLSYQYGIPDLVKIDVDGNEQRILRGGRHFFSCASPPRSVQVEMPPTDAATIESLMEEYGYVKERVHYTASGQQQIDKGTYPADVIHNAIFRKAA